MTATRSAWRTSSYSNGANNNCVEFRLTPESAGIRDTKSRTAGTLSCGPAQWAALVASLREA